MFTQSAIELEGLTKSFRVRRARGSRLGQRFADLIVPRTERVAAVDRISFRIGAGERVAFIGPNGAGKSTTLKILSGILHPDAGKAEVAGFVPWKDRRALSFAVGTVFGQRSQLWYQLPPKDTFALLARVFELSNAEARERLDALVSMFELGALLDKPVRQLSLGERMRCELAASLLHRPRILFLDEPTIGLDASAKAVIRELLQRQSRDAGATLLLTSHDTGDIEQVCDRVIVIQKGRVLLDGPIGSLRQRYLNTRRATLVTGAEQLVLELAGVRVLETKPHRTTFEIDASVVSIGALVDRALKQTTVLDLSIEDPPLDEVIRALYRSAGQETQPCTARD